MASMKSAKKVTAKANSRLDLVRDAFTKGSVTSAAQAKSKADVDSQDWQTRLWQSLKNNYDNQRDESAKQYDQARLNADRQAQSRGMGRSSYNNQTLANIDKEKVNADNKIQSALIADYQNRLQQGLQWQDQLKLQQEQLDLQKQQWEWQKQQASAASASGGGRSGYRSGNGNGNGNGDDQNHGDGDGTDNNWLALLAANNVLNGVAAGGNNVAGSALYQSAQASAQNIWNNFLNSSKKQQPSMGVVRGDRL